MTKIGQRVRFLTEFVAVPVRIHKYSVQLLLDESNLYTQMCKTFQFFSWNLFLNLSGRVLILAPSLLF